MTRRENERPEALERDLREGMAYLLNGMEKESPPDVAALQMLVQQVQREQQEALRRDLTRFALAAVVILCIGLFGFLQFPTYYLIAQGVLGTVLLATALVWQAEGGRTSHE
jgi:hypothetical protein